MGIVIRQTFWSSIFSYLGVFLGLINTVILMPKFLTEIEIGLFRTIFSASSLLVPFATIGLTSALIRSKPRYKGKHLHAFYGTSFIVLCVATSLVIIFTYGFKGLFFDFFEDKSPQVNDYLQLIFLWLIQMVLSNYLQVLLKAELNISLTNFLVGIFLKVMHLLALVGIWIGLLDFQLYLYLHLVFYIAMNLISIIVLLRKYGISLHFEPRLFSAHLHELFPYSFYSTLNMLGFAIILQLDQLMISSYLGLEANAIYTTAIFITIIIELPRNLINQIAAPLISQSFANKDLPAIGKLYKQASINQILLGSFIFCIIFASIDAFFSLMPNGDIYKAGKWVALIVGVAKVIDMSFSMNGEIIGLSSFYRINILFSVILGGLAFVLNLILIPKFGIEGASVATLAAFLIFNVGKYLTIKSKLALSLFDQNTLKAILPSILSLGLMLSIPRVDNVILFAAINIAIVLVCYLLLVLTLRPSAEIHNILVKSRDWIKSKLFRTLDH